MQAADRLWRRLTGSWNEARDVVAEQRRILVVDDDGSLRMLLRVYLEGKGYGVSDAPDGETALLMARKTVPHLVLLDLTMPDTDGWHALAEFRRDPVLGDVPVVVLTGSADESIEWRAKELGAARYVTKTVNLEELLNTVNEVLASPFPE